MWRKEIKIVKIVEIMENKNLEINNFKSTQLN